MEYLIAHQWPGNVRELENVIERALNIVADGNILPAHLPDYVTERVSFSSIDPESYIPALNMDNSMAGAEKDLILKALAEAGGNRSRAAQILGISRTKLYDRLNRHGIGQKQ
jgi:transcriptional regulator with PAS, ATPase and Fis domain